METADGKQTPLPRIATLMAVYEPRMDWLREQLLSLNAQTYPNLMLYVRDDHSPTVPYEEVQSCVQDCISAFPYSIQRNEKNHGSNLTFERLTREAEGDLFAYCDQDDVWLPEKLTVLQQSMAESGALLACSDMSVMDGAGKTVARNINEVRPQKFRSGTGLARELLFRNFVTGCTMLVDARTAKEAVPFCPGMVHDQYLALLCADRGAILSLEQPLIRYRIHGENQTGTLSGVSDKKSYERIRVEGSILRMEWLRDHMEFHDADARKALDDAMLWTQARRRHWQHRGGFFTVWKYRWFSPVTVYFESIAPYLPDVVFRKIVRLRKRTTM